mmetsp:Transcript_20305/g.43937  ORF Transcript_20305/g.43937 Transcript_20305/m.43937 type:complete len:256 (+) Transcript_20305:73-840(+)|eukprot:CAMPEP_0168738866 /NCGR_PEP_ID=MMETSP0724-20121128/11158_1 /TAXON_ID=265536 /ORGANISM="Amphiprora sp., Strain CCMP467" /LENGTH=255 /DNA_ID=CAMNT_0008786231 /DNA_START=50 /DNA_END=817 /DNA_ORIENTATION=+
MRLRTLYGWHLSSSILFLLGTWGPLVGHIEYKYFFTYDYNVLFKTIEAVGWVLLTFHVLPEIVVDMNTFPGRSRRLAHLRYGPTPWPNLAQSLVFASACFFQGSYYVQEWYIGNSEEKERLRTAADVMNLIAGHFWLLSGVLTAISLGFRFMCCGSSPRLSIVEQIMSDLYILTTVILCGTSYINLLAPNLLEDLLQGINLNEPLDFYIHLGVRSIWAFLGLFYVIVDARTMTKGRSRSERDPETPLRKNGGEYA